MSTITEIAIIVETYKNISWFFNYKNGYLKAHRNIVYIIEGFPSGASGKEPTCQCRKYNETQVQSLGWEDPLEESMATHFSILAWRIPRTEEPGVLQSIELHRVRHD